MTPTSRKPWTSVSCFGLADDQTLVYWLTFYEANHQAVTDREYMDRLEHIYHRKRQVTPSRYQGNILCNGTTGIPAHVVEPGEDGKLKKCHFHLHKRHLVSVKRKDHPDLVGHCHPPLGSLADNWRKYRDSTMYEMVYYYAEKSADFPVVIRRVLKKFPEVRREKISTSWSRLTWSSMASIWSLLWRSG